MSKPERERETERKKAREWAIQTERRRVSKPEREKAWMTGERKRASKTERQRE